MARQARSLDVLLAEINALSPDRNKLSDGGIGDPAHSVRESDHNPNDAGVWRARDVTDDDRDDNQDGAQFGDVFDCDWLASRLVAMYHETPVHPAMRSGAYTIYKGRIYSFDRRDQGWRPYPGSNPHDHHLHQSVATAATGYDSTAPWGINQEDDVTPQDRKAIVDDLLARQIKLGDGKVVSVEQALKQAANAPAVTRKELDAAVAELKQTINGRR